MSVIRMHFFSETLGMCASANVILPLPRSADVPVQDLPVLYLLHGMGDDYTSWLRKTAAERYALEHGIAIVMPDGALSCWEDMIHGRRYRSYITKELPQIIRSSFPVSRDREKTFIAGCSMGGFGALKLALANPEQYSCAGCFSAAHFEYRPDSPRHNAMLQRVYGDQLDAYDAQIVRDAVSANAGDLPLNIWHSCGDQDALKQNALISRAFFEGMQPGSIRYQFEMLPGKHDWALWDASLKHFLQTLNLNQSEVQLF